MQIYISKSMTTCNSIACKYIKHAYCKSSNKGPGLISNLGEDGSLIRGALIRRGGGGGGRRGRLINFFPKSCPDMIIQFLFLTSRKRPLDRIEQNLRNKACNIKDSICNYHETCFVRLIRQFIRSEP